LKENNHNEMLILSLFFGLKMWEIICIWRQIHFSWYSKYFLFYYSTTSLNSFWYWADVGVGVGRKWPTLTTHVKTKMIYQSSYKAQFPCPQRSVRFIAHREIVREICVFWKLFFFGYRMVKMCLLAMTFYG